MPNPAIPSQFQQRENWFVMKSGMHFTPKVATLLAFLAAVIAPLPAAEANFLPPPVDAGSSAVITRAGETIPLRPELLTEKPLPLQVPDVYKEKLANGIQFYHYESKDLPRIQVSLLINAGSMLEPADKVGAADLTARGLRSGGAGDRNADGIERDLERRGSELSLSVGREYASGRLFALTENRDKAMQILADILLRPQFDEQKLQQQKDLIVEGLRRQNDEPGEMSRREFRKVIYGKDHPLARVPTPAQVTSLSRADVQKFYDSFYRPASISVGVSGDISRDDARKLVEGALGTWNKPAAEVPAPPAIADAADSSAGVYIARKLTAQSQIRIGHLGMRRHEPLQYASAVLNGIYGTGGFSSRLMNRVRTKRGFVYGVGGGVFNDQPQGLFVASAASKSRTTAAAIEEILDVTRGLLKDEITDDEIETAKRDAIFSFFTEFDEPAELINKYMVTDFQGYPADYLKTYPERIRAVTREELFAAAKQYIHPDRLKIFVVGFEKQFDKPLSTFGPVSEWIIEGASQDPAQP